VVRRDLKLRRGKEIGQGSHAAMAWLRDRYRRGLQDLISEEERSFLFRLPIVIVFQIDSEEALLALEAKAKEHKLTTYLIRDAGKTEVAPDTPTALGIGPNWSENLAKVTADLKLY